MVPPWEYFEYLNDLVYVVDPETHEMVYLNRHGRAAFRMEEGAYQGKHCYEILQGLKQRCPFCNNDQLEEGKFLEWTYYNPVLQASFAIKDTLLRHEGKCYRVEFASREKEKAEEGAPLSSSAIINECLLRANAAHDLYCGLEYLGTHVGCQALAIYEIRDGTWIVNTYLWTREGGQARKEEFTLGLMQAMDQWEQIFTDNQPVLMYDAEDACRKMPGLCPLLRQGGNRRTIVVPLVDKMKSVGFFCVYEPDRERMPAIADICRILSVYIVSALQQRDLMRNLEQLSYHDQMTGALNRHALEAYMALPLLEEDTGLVFCDILGLKNVNDLFGHIDGDKLIIQVYHLLSGVFRQDGIYRVGGDEFLVHCGGRGEETFRRQVERLRQTLAENQCGLSVGSVWAKAGSCSFSQLVDRADQRMYEEKRAYYRRQASADSIAETVGNAAFSVPLQQFLRDYFFDTDTFIQSISMLGAACYFVCGDLRKSAYYISDSLRDDFGFSSNLAYDFSTALGIQLYEVDKPLHAAKIRDVLEKKEENFSLRYRVYRRDGRLVWLHCRGRVKWDADKSHPLFFSGTMVELRNQAEVDQVTGLLNLSMAISHVEELLERGETFTLLCVSFRNYGDINLLLSRETGNELLREAGQRLEQRLDSQFCFFRMDGAKILIVCPGTPDLHQTAREIRFTVNSVYDIYGLHILYPCGVGALTVRDAGGRSAQELLDNAQAAAKVAKTVPTLDFSEYKWNASAGQQSSKDLNLVLNHCVNHQFEGFRIVIQPQVETDSGRIVGGEALMRWRNRDTDVPPGLFIPILEQNGLILPAGRWVMEQALKACAAILPIWPDFKMAVNVSYLQVLDRDFFSQILKLLERYGVPADCLVIELTETHFDEMPSHLERFVSQCQQAGILFAIDDFGSAYSGLQLLLKYPADVIKLDRNLLCEIKSSEQKKNFLMSIVYACHRFGKKVCMEGVETVEELRITCQSGCDYVQGFYFYKPMDLEALLPVLEEERRKSDGRGS